MTASLPVPDPPTPSDSSEASADAVSEAPKKAPRAPRATTPRTPRAPRTAKRPASPRTPAAPRTPRAAPIEAPGADDLVVPPRPPLPPLPPISAAEAAAAPAPVIEPEPVVEPEPAVEAGPVVEAEPVVEPAVEPEPEPEPDVEAEPVVEPEPAVEAEPELEPIQTPKPVEEATSVAVAEPVAEPVVEFEPVDVVESAPDPVPTVEDAVPAVVIDAAAVSTASDVPALTLRGVTKSFGGTRAVDDIDLTVPAGSFYGLVGPNGAGKTTTLSMIAGLLRADHGTIEVNGIDARRSATAAKRLLGVLPDRLRTFDRLTGRQLLYYYGVLRGLPSAVVESRTADLARAFDLVDALGRPVSDYSAGMTKKVMLAGAMIHSPRVLVLDEPFESVDPVSSAVILEILTTYVAHGGTVILSSHGMELVERVCSRVAVIVAGQVLAEGTVDEVRGDLTLEQRFLELAGGLGDVEGLEWLHTFSD